MSFKKNDLATLDSAMQELLDVPLPSPHNNVQIKDEETRKPIGPELLPNLPPDNPTAQKKKQPIIGSYRVTKTLGQGTFGKVKEGIHLFTQQKVAIKILEKDKITEVTDVERVSREIHILKIVRHPHII